MFDTSISLAEFIKKIVPIKLACETGVHGKYNDDSTYSKSRQLFDRLYTLVKHMCTCFQILKVS